MYESISILKGKHRTWRISRGVTPKGYNWHVHFWVEGFGWMWWSEFKTRTKALFEIDRFESGMEVQNG